MKGVLLVSALVALIPSVPSSRELAFKPTKDAQVRKTFEESTRWTVDEIEVLIDGAGAREEPPEMVGTCERKLVVVDKYEAVEEAVTMRLSREFEKISGSSVIAITTPEGKVDPKVDLGSALEDARVLFVRKDASSPPVAKWARDDGASTAALGGLRDDLDLRAFMTESGLSEGDHWKVDASTLADVLAPGGELGLEPRSGGVPAGGGLDAVSIVAASFCALTDNTGKLAGEVLCTWTDTKKGADGELATVELEWESTSDTEVDERFARRCEAAKVAYDGDLSLSMRWTSKGKGQIEWDLQAGCARGLELVLDSQIELRLERSESGRRADYRIKLEAQSKASGTFEAAK